MQIGIPNIQQVCLICDQTCKNRKSLAMHLLRSHRDIVTTTQEYVDKFILKSPILCKCGCGEKTKWNKVKGQYNVYINFHNETGFKIKQPNFTKEQLEKRKKSIKKTYSDPVKGKIVREKISNSVKIGAANSDFDRSKCFKNLWNTKSFKNKQHISRKKSWSGQVGKIRRKKVFTPEFSRKISIANMKNNTRKISKAEIQFSNILKSKGLNIELSKWFNFSSKTWCADVWLPDEKVIIEFDGIYYHGLDRDSNWNYTQLTSIANDLLKNKIAIDKKLNLLRFDENVDISNCNSIDDLIKKAYHVVIEGNVIKEGSFKLKDDQVIISRDKLILTSDKNKIKFKNALRNVLNHYVNYWGWYYPEYNLELSKTLNSIKNCNYSNNYLSMSTSGSTFLKQQFKSFWNVNNGPVEASQSRKHIDAVLSYRLGLNNSKLYEYTLSSGEKVKTNEHFDITLSTIRTGFIVRNNAVSWFKPATAAHVYKILLSSKIQPTVWDPSGGFGARMLGFFAMYENGKYFTTEPATQTYNDLLNLKNEFFKNNVNINCEIFKQGSEKELRINDNSVDLVFTSPPYFDLEKYYNETGQCWKDYPTLDLWKQNYLIPTLKNANRILKQDGMLAINVNNKLSQLIIECAKICDFEKVNELKMRLQTSHFHKNSKKENYEPILVFKKSS